MADMEDLAHLLDLDWGANDGEPFCFLEYEAAAGGLEGAALGQEQQAPSRTRPRL